MSRKKSTVKRPSVIPGESCKVRMGLCVDGAEEEDTELVFELFMDRAPKSADNFRQLITGVMSADKKNPRTLGYTDTAIFRFTDYMMQGGDVINTITGLEGPPASGWKGQESSFGGLFEDERTWEAYADKDVGCEDEGAEVGDGKDVDQCKKICLEKGYGGFSIRGGKARYRKETPEQLQENLALQEGVTLYTYNGPSTPRHVFGSLSLANSGPDSNGSQFFICIKTSPWLDGLHTVVGKLVAGDLQAIHDKVYPQCNKDGFTPTPKTCYVKNCAVVPTSPEPPAEVS
eukprot:TRINITY_DN10514_c1_g1_i1.p1 TRINITY_DN10514_c1_g1~~TRINITY_DN10514_c1_g1_i1.p1  ORF type:complete len:310 (+),score=73.57 TRINITY_DN10514_c1_g1_i1:69-932(+)